MLVDRHVVRRERRGHEQREERVEHGDRAAARDDQRREEDCGREQRGRGREEAAREKEHDQRAQGRRERDRQPHRERVLAESRERRGIQPVTQDRLLEVADAVEVRRDPIAREDHLARDLAVANFVRRRERPHAERREVDDREQD